MFKKKTVPGLEIFPEKLANRVSKIPTTELSTWADQALYELGRCLSSYQRSGDNLYIAEALIGAQALHAVVTVMEQRSIKL